MADRTPNPGDTRLVFDAEAWRAAGFDQPDGNDRFWRPARILEVRSYARTRFRSAERVADIEWVHSGRVSHGHFTDLMRDA